MTSAPAVTTRVADESADLTLPDLWDAYPAADPRARRAVREREASWLEDARLIEDLSAVSVRRLRTLANRLYELLDNDFPPAETLERYQAITEELALRTGDTEAP
ncbi:hypothetical protein I6N91_16835 [Arthrobacter sp. MSA 4-2]|uniref:hypothetical protein n=1 Tax=Arthrobacter sp. MSA 4-2 TaxID=2794349 RepID=UPI0018E75162|nr:hypothetical protein [Arthrobacter sp. MSA 4-2]MBJ2122644.1 hypothetical protein [Arthrobacter sp. MSA 4-2]